MAVSIPELFFIVALVVALIDYFGDRDVLWLSVILICVGLLWGRV